MSAAQRTYLAWAAAWLLTRAFMVVQAGFFNDVDGGQLQDVYLFHAWSDQLAGTHALPRSDNWQYPPLVAFLLLLPRVFDAPFGEAFVGLMLLVDLLGLVLVATLARRERRDAGVWAWLLLMPCMGAIPLLRFDLVPTVIAVGGLVAIRMRAFWLGALLGAGAMLKLWPLAVLLAERDRRRLLRAAAGVAVAAVAVFASAALAFGDQSGFLDHQQQRGLQVEAIGATPWHVARVVSGEPVATVFRNGTNELSAPLAATLADGLGWLMLLLGLAAAGWWIMRERIVRRGSVCGCERDSAGGANGDESAADDGFHDDAARYLTSLAAGRDAVFTVVLLSIVVSRVLSPQFMIWLVGLVAVVLCSRETRLARPAWIVAAAVVMTVGLYPGAPALELSDVNPTTLVLRNVALLIAAGDASATMWRAVRPRDDGNRRTSAPTV
ncbi:glycosyltransferase 87 family protein [Conexibacter sp. CPCC 206217]|uniref:glycosyltransferase 87 family protein n=1 Tax=Conexibacter sp. CPCC 206217 TaxID=3064574 RepID=UPI00271C057A|nr:glycosyltransferase 87 family protein [Conexibacter sp. CPCC 206217]MDO8213962.1 glycosyltransferase 87 family protein [Conexibacter sp. CPCC 206217]